MKKLIETISRGKVLLCVGSLFCILCIFANTLLKQNFTYLTQTFHYVPEEAYRLLTDIGVTGRSAHVQILYVDVIMTILYTLFFIGLNYKLMCRLTRNCHVITVITFFPLLLMIVQISEIIATGIMINTYVEGYNNIAQCASTFTVLKFFLTPICFALPIILIGVTIIQRKMRGKRDN